MKKSIFRGVGTALITPFKEGTIDYQALEKIIEIKGTDLNNKAKNISFKNLTFAHGAYNEFDNGVIGDQAQLKILNYVPDTAHPLDSNITGANIRVSAADNIQFTDNVFYGLAAVGVGLYDGA